MSRELERHRVVKALRDAGVAGLTLNALIETCGLGRSTVFRHLATLIKRGEVEKDSVESGNRGRPVRIYVWRK